MKSTDSVQDETGDTPAKASFSFKKALPLLVLIGGLAAFLALGGGQYIGFDTLQEHHDALTAWVAGHIVQAALIYFAAYAVVVAFSLPGGAIMTILGGFLFGWAVGGALAVFGATLGATAIFLAARSALGAVFRARAGGWVARLEKGFEANAFSYLLTLRLIPVVPFWLLNIVPAFSGVTLKTYVAATFIGIIPGTFVYASVGTGLGSILAAGGEPDLGVIFSLAVLRPLLGLAFLALLPVIYRYFKGRFGQDIPS